MLKIANQILDIYDDMSKETLEKLCAKNPTCNVIDSEKRASLKDHEFALTVITKKASKLNKYPICDKDSTWVSSQMFEAHGHKLPEVAQSIAALNIKTACEKFGMKVSSATEKLAAKAPKDTANVYFEKEGALRKVIHSETVNMSKLAAVEEITANHTSAQYAMPNAAAVKIACDYFEKNHSKMPVLSRHKYAAAIQKRAHELGMGVQKGTVVKYASDHYSPMVEAHMRSRASLLEHKPELRDTAMKLAAATKSYTPSEFAQIVYSFDKQAGLDRYYGSHLQDPFQASFASEPDPYAGFRYKSASSSVLEGDDLQKLATAKYAKVKEYFGDSFADQFKKHPTAIFDSLPVDAKEILVGIANGTH